MQGRELDPMAYRQMLADLVAEPCTDEKFCRLTKVIDAPEFWSRSGPDSGAAVMGLVNCGSRALPVIRPLLDKPHSQIAAFAISALVDLRDERSYAKIFRYLDPYYSFAQDSALGAVARLNAYDQVEKVVWLLIHYAHPVQWAAWQTLLELTGLTSLQDGQSELEALDVPTRHIARIRALKVWPDVLIDGFERSRTGVALGAKLKVGAPVSTDLRGYWRTGIWLACDQLVTFALGCIGKSDEVTETMNSAPYRKLLLEMKKDLAASPAPILSVERAPRDIVVQMSDLANSD